MTQPGSRARFEPDPDRLPWQRLSRIVGDCERRPRWGFPGIRIAIWWAEAALLRIVQTIPGTPEPMRGTGGSTIGFEFFLRSRQVLVNLRKVFKTAVLFKGLGAGFLVIPGYRRKERRESTTLFSSAHYIK